MKILWLLTLFLLIVIVGFIIKDSLAKREKFGEMLSSTDYVANNYGDLGTKCEISNVTDKVSHPYLGVLKTVAFSVPDNEHLSVLGTGCMIPKDTMKALQPTGPELTCTQLDPNLKDWKVSNYHPNDPNIGNTPPTTEGCYIELVGESGDPIQKLNRLLDNVKERDTKQNNEVLNKLRTTESSQNSTINDNKGKISTLNSSIVDINTAIGIATTSIQSGQSSLDALIANNDWLQTNLNKLYSSLRNTAAVQSDYRFVYTSSGSQIPQKKYKDGRYFTLLYKYCNTGNFSSQYDPYELWKGSLSTPTIKNFDELFNSSQVYRDAARMSEVFNSSDTYDILIEVYNDKYQKGWMLFQRNPNQDDESWFSKQNYIDGTISGVKDYNYQFFSIKGHSEVRRRWFINVTYGGCETDPSAFVVPFQDVCEWDKAHKGFIIMASYSKPFNIGGNNWLNLEGKTRADISNQFRGNIMHVYACKRAGDPYQNLSTSPPPPPPPPTPSLPAYSAPGVLLNKTFMMRVPNKANLCVDDGGVLGANQGYMHIWACDRNNVNQHFRYDPNTRQILSTKSGLCIDDGGANTSGGSLFRLNSCRSDSQTQKFDYNENTKMFTLSTRPNLCMDDGGASYSGQVKMHPWQCDTNNGNQKFEILDINSDPTNPSSWRCMPGVLTPVRQNNNRDIECMSTNARDCMWTGSESQCKNLATNIPQSLRPLACGDMHRNVWGGIGYDIPSHWCALGRQQVYNQVTFFEHCDFQGQSKSFNPGNYNMNEIGIPNDSLSSIRIPPGMFVRIYEHANFQGRSLQFSSDVSCLVNQGFNDTASSWIVSNRPIP